MESETAFSALWVMLGLVAAYFLLPPILIFAMQRFPQEPHLIPFDDDQKLPASIASFFEDCQASLLGLGFETRGRYALPDPVPNVKAFLELYVHPRDRASAMVTCCFGLNGKQVIEQVPYTEFVSRFRHGEYELIQTNNLHDPGAFPPEPLELTFRLPMVQDLGALYGLHRECIERHAGKLKSHLRLDEEFDGDPDAYLQAVFAETYQRQEDRGWLRSDEAAQIWRPTTWGACRMAWQELWPFKALRRARLAAKARRLLAELRPELL